MRSIKGRLREIQQDFSIADSNFQRRFMEEQQPKQFQLRSAGSASA